MKNIAITLAAIVAEDVDPLDLYPQLKADVLTAPLIAIVEEEEKETHATQFAASQFVRDQGGSLCFVVNCTVEDAFDYPASFEALRAAIAGALGVAEGDVTIPTVEESDIPE